MSSTVLEEYKNKVVGLEQQLQQHKQELEHEFQVKEMRRINYM
jgi:hypothetical protein